MRSASVFLALVPDFDDSPYTDWSSATLSGDCARLRDNFSAERNKRHRATNFEGVWNAFDTGLAFPGAVASLSS